MTDRFGVSRRAMLAGTAITLGGVPGLAAGQSTPTVLWEYEADRGIGASPTVVDGTVYTASTDRVLHAVDAETGDGLWTVDGEGSYPLSVIDDVVYSTGQETVAREASSGEAIWESPISDQLRFQTVVGDLLVGTTGKDLIGLDVASGEEEWRFFDPSGANVGSSPTVVEGIAVAGLGAAACFAVDVDTGERRWKHDMELNGHVYSSPTVVDGTVIVGSDDGNVYALDLQTGEEEWVTETGFTRSSPTVHDGVVYVGGTPDATATVYALDVENGDELWQTAVEGAGVDSGLTIADGVVYASAQGFDDTLYALDAASGDIEWSFGVDRTLTDPIVVDDIAYVASQDNTLYALEAGGSSEGTRVELGTLNHHDTWADRSPTIDVGSGSEDGDDQPDDEPQESDDEATDDDDDTGDDDGSPGPGAVGAAAAVGSVAYYLSRRSADETN